ncbi:hypothetical protein C8R41DRAFT_860648 [Lentinula lateritia]|uniref:DUF1279 domain-containing protein n=1 Tax=Lentinula lateritia TaxID=40482 RepID=A0ABQ8UZ99_9AGAR|nr:hypothetical protein C8R41DRAFT_860648 [Lentinula lateritia]
MEFRPKIFIPDESNKELSDLRSLIWWRFVSWYSLTLHLGQAFTKYLLFHGVPRIVASFYFLKTLDEKNGRETDPIEKLIRAVTRCVTVYVAMISPRAISKFGFYLVTRQALSQTKDKR